MAKEAIEQVRLAEQKAAEIIKTAEQESADMISAVGEEAKSSLERERAAAFERVQKAQLDAKKREGELLAAAEGAIEEKCAKKRAAMLEKKEMIISRILAAVRE